MRIIRFDIETAIPISQHDSRFSVGPLTGPLGPVAVQAMYLPPGGRIGRHPTDQLQLLAVVSGSGWASGGDGRRRDLRAGYGAVFDPGEQHETGTTEGLTAVCVEGKFEIFALTVTADIRVVDYDPAWPAHFERLRAAIWPAVEAVAVRIDHVGSTSVPGLAAKPIIDMDVVVTDESLVPAAVAALKRIGYRWRGDLGVPGRQAFARPRPKSDPQYHLYVVVEDNKAHLDHVLLRDLLREDAVARDRYAALKLRNAEESDGDMDVYVAAKAELVAELLTRARAERGLPPADYWQPC